jgi:metal-responsive CopG/Arc/MetJ family transcriptional regulator
MSRLKIAITVDRDLLVRLDRLVKARHFPNRDRAVENALRGQLKRRECNRLALECAKLDPRFEQQMAEGHL